MSKTRGFLILLLVEGNKIAFLEQSTTNTAADCRDEDQKPVGVLLPTAHAGIHHGALVTEVSSSSDRDLFTVQVVDAWRDLSLSIQDAVEKLETKGWKKAEHSHELRWELRDHFKQLLKLV